jgi:AraC-like DNA-binding protein
MAPTVRASALASYAEVARSLSLNPVAMMRRVGLDPLALTVPDMRLKAEGFGRLLQLSAAETGCETFGLRMAQLRTMSDFGALSLLISHQATVRDVLATLVRYSDVINEALSLSVDEFGRTAIIREELVGVRGGMARQGDELAVGVIARMLRALIGERWHPLAVHLVHAPPADLTEHLRMLGNVIRFDSDFNGIVCDSTDLDRTNPGADAVLVRHAESLVEQVSPVGMRDIETLVRKALQDLLPGGRATLAQVATRLGLGERSLQRRLTDRGVGFRALLDEVRDELAQRHLADGSSPLIEVERRLGYSQPAAFTRWHRARFGETPSARRRRTSPD